MNPNLESVNRLRDGKWVLGGIQRGTDNIFLEVVDRRDANTLLGVIQRNVLPGTQMSGLHTETYPQMAISMQRSTTLTILSIQLRVCTPRMLRACGNMQRTN